MTDLVGQTFGSYRLVEQVGSGGMAVVYKALHTSLSIYRAVKVIRPELVISEDFRARFLKEAQAVASLRHPNIVQLHDFGAHENIYFMVMEYLEGGQLKQLLARTGIVRPIERAVDLILPVAHALEYAHSRGVIHRDIKPENMMFSGSGEIVLTDFGIAKLVTGGPNLTRTGMVIGTAEYMAPEQSLATSEVGPATDVYSLSIVLYEMLTGRVPFTADTDIGVAVKSITEPLPLPQSLSPDIGQDVQGVIVKGLAKSVGDRYPSMHAFRLALEAAVANDGARPAGGPPAATRLRPAAGHATGPFTSPGHQPYSTGSSEAPTGASVLRASTKPIFASAAPRSGGEYSLRRFALVAGVVAATVVAGVGFVAWKFLNQDPLPLATPAVAVVAAPAETTAIASTPREAATNNLAEIQRSIEEADRKTAEVRTLADKAAADRAAAEKALADRMAAERLAADRATAEKTLADRVAAEKALADRVAAEKTLADRLAAEKAVAAQLAAEKVEADRLATEKAAREEQERQRSAEAKRQADAARAEEERQAAAARAKVEAERLAQIERQNAERKALQDAAESVSRQITQGLVRIAGGEMLVVGEKRVTGAMTNGGVQVEEPKKSFTIPAFQISRNEITREQFEIFAKVRGYPLPAGYKPDPALAQRAMVGASWEDARAFVSWIRESGIKARLPSEAEWVYASRKSVDTSGSAAAGSPKLVDIAGGMDEWVEDCAGEFLDAPADGKAQVSAGCRKRIYRGASMKGSGAKQSLVELRKDRAASDRLPTLGFRLAVD